MNEKQVNELLKVLRSLVKEVKGVRNELRLARGGGDVSLSSEEYLERFGGYSEDDQDYLATL